MITKQHEDVEKIVVDENGKEIQLDSPEQLYDFLVEYYK